MANTNLARELRYSLSELKNKMSDASMIMKDLAGLENNPTKSVGLMRHALFLDGSISSIERWIADVDSEYFPNG